MEKKHFIFFTYLCWFRAYLAVVRVHLSGADSGWSVRGGVEAKIGRKRANFARFRPILEGAVPPTPPSGSTTACIVCDMMGKLTF